MVRTQTLKCFHIAYEQKLKINSMHFKIYFITYVNFPRYCDLRAAFKHPKQLFVLFFEE